MNEIQLLDGHIMEHAYLYIISSISEHLYLIADGKGTHIDTQQIHPSAFSKLLHSRIEEDAAATMAAKLVQIFLWSKRVGPQNIFALANLYLLT